MIYIPKLVDQEGEMLPPKRVFFFQGKIRVLWKDDVQLGSRMSSVMPVDRDWLVVFVYWSVVKVVTGQDLGYFLLGKQLQPSTDGASKSIHPAFLRF